MYGQQFEDIQKVGKENIDVALRSASAVTRGVQTAAAEAAEFAKRAFEQNSQTLEQLLGARSIDRAVMIQQDYAKASYEAFVAYATKLGQIYTDLAKEAVKPVEGAFAKAQDFAAKAQDNVQASASKIAA